MHAALLAEESLLVLELRGLLDDVDRPFPSQKSCFLDKTKSEYILYLFENKV